MVLDSEEGVAPLPNLPSGVAPAKPALGRGSHTSDEVRESLRDE
jgi:hypothetical protein